MKLLHKGTVKEGKLVFDDPATFSVSKVNLEGKRFELTLEKEINRRTSQQNRYYRGVVLPAITTLQSNYSHCQIERDQMHLALKELFASHRLDNGVLILEETHLYDTVRFTHFVDDCKKWALDFFGYRILDAGEVEL